MTPDDPGPAGDPPTEPVPPDPDVPDATGHLVGGRYELLRSLGRGGMGVVWQARDITLDRAVAVKEVTLPPGLDERQRSQLRERTLREARAAARISSEAAVTVYDVVEEDGRPWIVMELLPPRSLADVVREQGPMDPGTAVAVGLRLLDALAAAHAAGVLHRDVKPANVLFDAAGAAVLTDFGIASLEGDTSLTTTGTVVGSPGYVAPERALGRSPSPASDLWSLGVTLAAAVHGRSPFEKDTPLATIVAAMQEPLSEEVVTGPLGPVIDRLLAKDPAARPDVAETRRLLEAAAAGGDAGPTRVMPAVTTPGNPAAAASAAADAELTQALPKVPVAPSAASTAGPRGAAAPAAAAPLAPRQPRQPRPAPAPAPPRASRLLPVALVLVALVLAAVAGFVLLDRRGDPTTTATGGATAGATTGPGLPTGQTTAETAATAASRARAAAPEDDDAAEEAPVRERARDVRGAARDDRGAPGRGRHRPGAGARGLQLHEDEGYRVAVPDGWTVEQDGQNRTTFSDPASRRYLLVEEGGEPAGDPVEDWERQERSVSERLAGYELIGIERADYRDFDSADWQFRWDAENGRLRVLNRAVVDPSIDRAYALYWSVPDEQWDDARPVFDSIAQSFQPLG